MSQSLVAIGKKNDGVLAALFAPDVKTAKRNIEFFTAQTKNLNTRKAHAKATCKCAVWCEEHRIGKLDAVRPAHVAAYIEGLQKNWRHPPLNSSSPRSECFLTGCWSAMWSRGSLQSRSGDENMSSKSQAPLALGRKSPGFD